MMDSSREYISSEEKYDYDDENINRRAERQFDKGLVYTLMSCLKGSKLLSLKRTQNKKKQRRGEGIIYPPLSRVGVGVCTTSVFATLDNRIRLALCANSRCLRQLRSFDGNIELACRPMSESERFQQLSR